MKHTVQALKISIVPFCMLSAENGEITANLFSLALIAFDGQRLILENIIKICLLPFFGSKKWG